MRRRPALAVFAGFLAGTVLAPYLGWLWGGASLILLASSSLRGARSDAALLLAVLALAAGYAEVPRPSLPLGPLLIEAEAHGTGIELPGRVERELWVGGQRVRATFPAQIHAGSEVTVVALAAGARKLRVVAQRRATPPGLLAHVRKGVARSLEGSAPGRGLLRAVLIGDRSGLGPELRRAFRETGCAHLLSISGLHVGVILGWALWLGRRWKHAWARRGLVAIALVGFVALVGPRPPTLRAAVVAGVWVCTPGRGDSINRLSCAGIVVLLHDPSAVHTLGFFLSFGTVTGLVLMARRPASLGGLVRAWLAVFAASCVMLAVSVGHVPWVNAALGPPTVFLLGLVLPLGLIGCAGALLVPSAAEWLLAPADLLATLLLDMVQLGSGTGAWSWLPLPRPELAAVGLGLALLAGLRRADCLRWKAWLGVAGCALCLAFWPRPAETLEVRISPRRNRVYLADGERFVAWGATASPDRREQLARRDLGGLWTRLGLTATPMAVDTKHGVVWIVPGHNARPPLQAGPVRLLVLLRPLSARRAEAWVRATRPEHVLAPASLGPLLDRLRVNSTLLAPRAGARCRLLSRKSPLRYGLRK